MDSKELIQSVEENFHQYYRLFDKIDLAGMESKPSGATHNFRELLLALTSIQDEVFEYRLRKILQEEHPYIPKIHVDQIKRKRYTQFSINQLGEVFLKQRKELVKLLYSLPKTDWQRTGLHELEGHITFMELVRRIVEKDKEAIEKLNQVMLA